MIQFISIKSSKDERFDFFWQLYKTSFPSFERRSKRGQVACLKQPEFYLEVISQENDDVGFITYWICENVLYVEHLAVMPQARNGGIGSLIMQAFLTQHQYEICLLEIDLPITKIAKRRKGFYQRLGFITNAHNHVQPPYKIGSPSVPMEIMTYPKIATVDQYNLFKNKMLSEISCRF